MTKHTDTSRSDELEKCFNLGDCAWTVCQAVRGYVARHLALIETLEAENERLRGVLRYYTDKDDYGERARAALGEKQ